MRNGSGTWQKLTMIFIVDESFCVCCNMILHRHMQFDVGVWKDLPSLSQGRLCIFFCLDINASKQLRSYQYNEDPRGKWSVMYFCLSKQCMWKWAQFLTTSCRLRFLLHDHGWYQLEQKICFRPKFHETMKIILTDFELLLYGDQPLSKIKVCSNRQSMGMIDTPEP